MLRMDVCLAGRNSVPTANRGQKDCCRAGTETRQHWGIKPFQQRIKVRTFCESQLNGSESCLKARLPGAMFFRLAGRELVEGEVTHGSPALVSNFAIAQNHIRSALPADMRAVAWCNRSSNPCLCNQLLPACSSAGCTHLVAIFASHEFLPVVAPTLAFLFLR